MRLAAIVVISVLVLVIGIRLAIGFFFGLLFPLLLIAVIAGLAYWLFARRGDKKG